MRKRKRIENDDHQKDQKKSKTINHYPKKILRNLNEITFIKNKQVWNKELNLKVNKKFHFLMFGKILKLDNDLYRFNKIGEIGSSLNIGERCNIFGYENEKNSTRSFVVGSSLDSIKELILKRENYLHEQFQDLPTKFFIDIDKVLPKSGINFNKERKSILKKIEIIKEIYEKRLFYVCNPNNISENISIGSNWIDLEASYDTKLSFHIIGNHTLYLNGKTEIPIYYKDCDHVNKMIEWVRNDAPLFCKTIIDSGIVTGKSLRMYFCSYKKSKDRMFLYKNEKKFNYEIFKKSLLQIHPEAIDNENFYQLELFNNNNNLYGDDEWVGLETIVNQGLLPLTQGNKPKPYQKKVKRSFKILSNEFHTLAKDFIDSFLDFLIAYKGTWYNFSFLKKHKNSIKIYRIKKERRHPFSLWVEIYFVRCLIQNHEHNHTTGRTIVLNPEEKKIIMICAAPKTQKHRNSFQLKLSKTSGKIKTKFWDFITKTKNE
jgi:hypothetical protein